MPTDMTVANTILEQLGGRRFIAMTGAKDFVGDKDSLRFRLPRARGKNGVVTHFYVRLDPSDTYTVESSRYDRKRLEVVRQEIGHGIYCDILRDVFTCMTGLATRL